MDCKYFDGCSAPLCPNDGGMAGRIWFPDEDVCRLADAPGWVRRQRKISRRAAPGGCFTAAMIGHDCRIRKGMKGMDPDETGAMRAGGEAAWFKAHPVISPELREKLKAAGEKKKELLHSARLKKLRSNTGVQT
jgi:hypothetical protein